MTRGIAGSEPAGHNADTFYILGMYATRGQPGLTTPALSHLVARENGQAAASPGQVRSALHSLARRTPPLVEQDRHGRWRVTGHGYTMLVTWCGDDDGPARVPCGTGWPA